ncbi:N/A [soil metagenome]
MKTSPKILLTNASHIYAGGEYYVLELAKELTSRKIDVTVCCHTKNLLYDKCRSTGIKLFGLDFPEKGQLFKHIRKLRDYSRENEINIIHTNTNYDRTAGAFAARLAGIYHVAAVHSFQSIDNNLTQKFRNRKAVDLFVPCGYSVKDLLIKEDGISGEKIKVIHLGIDPETMKRIPELRQKIRNEFGIKDNEILIGNVGRLEEFKGQEYLIKAISLLRNYNNLKVMIVGDGRLEMFLKEFADSCGVKDNFIFPLFRDDMQAIYSAFDIYAQPSIEGGGETFPFSVLNSLAAGLPAVVTRVGDVAEMIVDGKTGYVVEEKDPVLLAERLQYLIDNENYNKEFGEAALQNLKAKFTLKKMTDNVINCYEDLLN